MRSERDENIFEILRGLENTSPQFEWSYNNGVIGIARLTLDSSKIPGSYYYLPPQGTKLYTFSDSAALEGKATGNEKALVSLLHAYKEKHSEALRLKERSRLFVPYSRGEPDVWDIRYNGTLQEFLTELGLLHADILSDEKIDEITELYPL